MVLEVLKFGEVLRRGDKIEGLSEDDLSHFILIFNRNLVQFGKVAIVVKYLLTYGPLLPHSIFDLPNNSFVFRFERAAFHVLFEETDEEDLGDYQVQQFDSSSYQDLSQPYSTANLFRDPKVAVADLSRILGLQAPSPFAIPQKTRDPSIKNPLYRTAMCRHGEKCTHRDSCQFAHTESELRRKGRRSNSKIESTQTSRGKSLSSAQAGIEKPLLSAQIPETSKF